MRKTEQRRCEILNLGGRGQVAPLHCEPAPHPHWLIITGPHHRHSPSATGPIGPPTRTARQAHSDLTAQAGRTGRSKRSPTGSTGPLDQSSDSTPEQQRPYTSAPATADWIPTGSSALSATERRQIRHNGTGRIAKLHMRPMALAESGDSLATVSLIKLLNQEPSRQSVIRRSWPTSRVGSAEEDGLPTLGYRTWPTKRQRLSTYNQSST